MGFLNRGIANVGDSIAGVVIDPINTTAEYLGYERPITDTPVSDLMDVTGVARSNREASTIIENIFQGAGSAAGALVPFGAGAKALSAAPNAVGKVAATLNAPAVAGPGRYAATEVIAGGGAGGGGEIGDRMAGGDSSTGRAVGEVVGGLSTALAPSSWRLALKTPIVSSARASLLDKLAPFTTKGARVKASQRVVGLAGGQDRANELADMLDQPNTGNLSPAQVTGDERLLSLERSILDCDAKLDAQFKERTQESIAALREAMTAPTQGATTADAQAVFQARREHLGGLLDARIDQAKDIAAQRLNDIEPRLQETRASEIVREEIDAALKAARSQEADLWAAVPESARVPTSNIYDRFDLIVSETSAAQREDIPKIARDVLEEWGRPDDQSVNEMHGLYSKLREVARNARSGTAPQANKGRIADEFADAILEDLSAPPSRLTSADSDSPIPDDLIEAGKSILSGEAPNEVSETINTARAFSRDISERFERGVVGKLLGRLRSGGDAIDPELTLSRSIGRGGADGKVALDDIKMAIGDGGDGPIDDFITRKFSDFAGRGDQIDAKKAATFMRNNAELLAARPELKARLDAAVTDTSKANTRIALDEGRQGDISNPRKSPGAAFVNAPAGRELEAVLNAKDPAKAARTLAREAAKDSTGNASRGLKSAFFDNLIAKSRTGEFEDGSFISGKALQKAMTDPNMKSVRGEILSDREVTRLSMIASKLRKVEASMQAGPLSDGALPDKPVAFISLIARTMGARQGARLGQGVSGASLVTANFVSKRAQSILEDLTVSKAEKLLNAAIIDKELFQALLRNEQPGDTSKSLTVISEWLAAQGGQELGRDEERAPLPAGFKLRAKSNAIGPNATPPDGFSIRDQKAALEQSSGSVANVKNLTPPPTDIEPNLTPSKIAAKFVGKNENRDKLTLSRFIRKMTGDDIDPSKTAWCAAWVNAVLGASGIEGTGSLAARSFLKFGTKAEKPGRGDLVVLSRGDPNGWQGHVGFYAGKVTRGGKEYIKVLGGNQDDGVNEKEYLASRVLGYRRPPKIEV